MPETKTARLVMRCTPADKTRIEAVVKARGLRSITELLEGALARDGVLATSSVDPPCVTRASARSIHPDVAARQRAINKARGGQ